MKISLYPAALVVSLFFSCGGNTDDTAQTETAIETPAPSSGYNPGAIADAGTLSGRVTFAGAIPQLKKLEITKDLSVCGAEGRYDESLLVSDNRGVANVVVKIRGILQGKAMGTGAYELDQSGCTFLPHVIVVPAGVPLTVYNSDGILHNVHTYSQ